MPTRRTLLQTAALGGTLGLISLAPIAAQANTRRPAIPARLQAVGRFSTLLQAAEAAGLVAALNSRGPLTLFAPTDDAFALLGWHTLDRLLSPAGREELVRILTYHVVPARVPASSLVGRVAKAETLQGGLVLADGRRQTLLVNRSRVLLADIPASNGIIHAIDRVLIPH